MLHDKIRVEYRALNTGEKAETHETNDEAFALFCEEAKNWLAHLGLVGWRVELEHTDDVDKDGGVLGYCEFYISGRCATIGLNKIWCQEPNPERIREVAFHEVCELLLAPLRNLAESRMATEEQADEATHAVIRTLENVLWTATMARQDGQDEFQAPQQAHPCMCDKGATRSPDSSTNGQRAGLSSEFIARINARPASKEGA